MKTEIMRLHIQQHFDNDIYDMLCVCWGSDIYKTD